MLRSLPQIAHSPLQSCRAHHLGRQGQDQGLAGQAVHVDYQGLDELAGLGLLPAVLGGGGELLLFGVDFKDGLAQAAGARPVDLGIQVDVDQVALR